MIDRKRTIERRTGERRTLVLAGEAHRATMAERARCLGLLRSLAYRGVSGGPAGELQRQWLALLEAAVVSGEQPPEDTVRLVRRAPAEE